MTGAPNSLNFVSKAEAALADAGLQRALAGLPGGLVAQRREAIARVPDFEALRDEGRDIRDHTLNHLAHYLEQFEANAIRAGSTVHWAATATDACRIIAGILDAANAKRIVKGKSMISEEIGLNAHLERAGLDVTETDLGEYIVQMRGEPPSHIIAPAIHLTQADVEQNFRDWHTHLPRDREFHAPAGLVAEARAVMREKFLASDAGITGANFLIAETGSSVIVTNEGNGDITQTLPKLHIVVASIEKVVPTLENAAALLRLLARSATGQDMTAYTTFATGPRRAGDLDGPAASHIVLIDNGRTEMLAGNMRDALRCIRCGACMNHCPVYNAIGGHAYGSVYPGPIGAVLTPALFGLAQSAHLPNASTFCGTCETVCPVKIPLVELMRGWRVEDNIRRGSSWALRAWSYAARRPQLYHLINRFASAMLHTLAGSRGAFTWLPFARGWTRHRDLPAPQGRTFQQLWAETKRGVPR